MKVLLDIDGVVMDILSAIQRLNSDFMPHEVYRYDFTESPNMGIPRSEVLSIIGSQDVFRVQAPYAYALLGVHEMKELDIDLIPFTAVPKDCFYIRRRQLDNLGLYGGYIYNVKDDKPVIEDVDFIIEDNPTELDKYPLEKRICLSRNYNMWYDDCKKFGNLHEIAMYMKEVLQCTSEIRSKS